MRGKLAFRKGINPNYS